MLKFYKLLLFMASFSLSATVVLVDNGQPEACIVLEERSTRSAQMGAFELQHHVKLITGVELPIFYGKTTQSEIVVIKIGEENTGLQGETCKISFSKGKILLTGNDSEDYGIVDYQNEKTFPSHQYNYRGSLYAVYEFLERYCGIRFYSHGDIGTVYEKRPTLAVEKKDFSHIPSMDGLRLIYENDWRETRFDSDRERMLWRLRWRQTVIFGEVNHNTYSIYFRYWDKAKHHPKLADLFIEKRPEYFAQGYEGKYHKSDIPLAKNYPDDPDLPPQLCYSSFGAAEYYANEAATYFRGNNVVGGWGNVWGQFPASKTLIPRMDNKPFFYPLQGTDVTSYCKCEKCMESFKGDRQLSNLKFNFTANVAKKLKESEPGAGIATLAYINTLQYPDQVDLPENISVQLCLTTYSWWNPGVRKFQENAYNEWLEKEKSRRSLFLWLYTFGPEHDAKYHFGNYKSFPVVYPWKTGELFKKFANDGIRGAFTETWMRYHELEGYVAMRLCYDKDTDVGQLLDEYFDRYYGAAGPAMKTICSELENAYWESRNYPSGWIKSGKVTGPRGTKNPAWGTGFHSPEVNWKIGSPQRMAKIGKLLHEAREKAQTPEEKMRVERFYCWIWQKAEQGFKEHKTVGKTINAFASVFHSNWNQVPVLSQWYDVDGIKSSEAVKMQLAYDKKNLYCHFLDKRPSWRDKNLPFWKNTLELLFSSVPDMPLVHLAISPSGEIKLLKHERINDVLHTSELYADVKVKHLATGDSWELELVIPLRLLPGTAKGLTANFIRISPEGSLYWSPIRTSHTLDGIKNFGRLYLGHVALTAEDFILGPASNPKARLIDDPHAVNNLGAVMNGKDGWAIQCPISAGLDLQTSYRISVRMRTDAAGAPGLFNRIGLYDFEKKKDLGHKRIMNDHVRGDMYREVEVGSYKMEPRQRFYIGGFNQDAGGGNIYVDSFIFRR